ncbi:hypothetical protein [Marinifilum caeruleilacunae]|uniref:Uncharacterized protein n=1 Tax=Marinifilum caeruleilacunae TaxID=2499076 RepID=A0ABX1WYE5_9BACT|nr:hypothetical protein [Marinifilum caeruleilacunae]NOU61137.1 hypothetical protein [Marinifilum caeruleilacunae]
MIQKYISLIICAVLLQACAGSAKFTSYWNSEQNAQHSTFSEQEALFYHSTDKISIKLFNNDEFVDIILETNSPRTLRKIYNLGLSLWIDPNGTSKNIYAVNFPMPAENPFTDQEFRSYLQRFSKVEYQEELIDRFQAYEIIDTRIDESVLTSTTALAEKVKVELKTSNQILFSYHTRIPMDILYPEKTEQKIISIGVSSVNEATEEYYSAMSSKQVIQKNLDELKAGAYQSKFELEEWWVNFKLAER